MLSKSPKSCDTFVVLPPCTKNKAVIFGKNSDRPQHEVQEVVLVKGGNRDEKLKCTYITIGESSSPVHTVILSKPAWMWGAEMGANEKNVVIGNEAVWTNNNEGDGDARQKRLLGMDLVRLGLERGDTAEAALDVITSLLQKYGQGGPCSEHDDSHFYHNSFLIADGKAAWVLETSGKLWAAEKIASGYRNISNGLTITTKIDKHSENLMEKAKLMGLWDGQVSLDNPINAFTFISCFHPSSNLQSEFNFTKCFSSGGDELRQQEGERLLKEASSTSLFDVKNMIKVLRHKESRICRGCDDTFPTQGSQVSLLSTESISVHWFTATPDPSVSFFKPFIFTLNAQASLHMVSPDEPLREHKLYKLHMECIRNNDGENTVKKLGELETMHIEEVDKFINNFESNQTALHDLDNLMKDCVETEINLYEKS